MTDTHQPDRLTVATYEAVIKALLRRQGIRYLVLGTAELRDERLIEFTMIPHAGGSIGVGRGSER